MRMLDLGRVPHHAVTAFGSESCCVGRLAPQASVTVATLRAGGVIGRHPAVGDQVLVLLSGRAIVSGDDGSRTELSVGQAVLWSAGEQHETRALTDVTALIVESEDPMDPLPG